MTSPDTLAGDLPCYPKGIRACERLESDPASFYTMYIRYIRAWEIFMHMRD